MFFVSRDINFVKQIQRAQIIYDIVGETFSLTAIVFVRHFEKEIPLTIYHGREMSTISGNVIACWLDHRGLRLFFTYVVRGKIGVPRIFVKDNATVFNSKVDLLTRHLRVGLDLLPYAIFWGHGGFLEARSNIYAPDGVYFNEEANTNLTGVTEGSRWLHAATMSRLNSYRNEWRAIALNEMVLKREQIFATQNNQTLGSKSAKANKNSQSMTECDDCCREE